ncbi:hypothetical protein [Flavobacterium sp. WC2430]|uniref:hypothetical protein n=1 Tax=Flavobacterium sp. WC2430 TaxID=3234137 RepID=UPI0034679290
MKLRFCILFVFILIHSFSFSQNKKTPFTFIVLGDMPYNLPKDNLKFENVIAALNKRNQAFNVFVGDFKSSKTPCSDTAFQKILGYFNSFKKPLIYTPGDNEWTDCGKPQAGSYNTNDRLSAIRAQFFKDTLHSLGKSTMELSSESSNVAYAKYVENKIWKYNGISFATIHLVGSNNNFNTDNLNSNEEFYERSNANIFWLNTVFEQAKKDNSLGIVIFEHADMITPDKGKEGFVTFLKELQKRVETYKKPVLLVNGDSHEYKVDKPLYENVELKKTVLNFTRLQVFGEADMHAVEVTVNPKNPALFEINQIWIPEINKF